MTSFLPCLLLLAGLPPVSDLSPAGQPPSRSRHIDGSKTPEQIPDDVAYDNLLRQLTGPGSASSRNHFASTSGLSQPDANLVFDGARRYAEALEESYRIGQEARSNATRRATPAQREAAMQAHLRTRQVLQELQRSFTLDLSPEGNAKLQAFVLNRVKRNMSMVVDSDDVPSPVSARPASAPAYSDGGALMWSIALGGAKSEIERDALIEAASNALMVRHMSETEAETIIELWNASTKPVAAFSIALCAPSLGMGSGRGFMPNLQAAAEPGATAKTSVSKRNRPQCSPFTPKVTAVIFDDGTAVGLPHQIQRFKLGLLGQIAETERIATILESAGDSLDLPALRQQIGEAPAGDTATLHAAFSNVLSPEDSAALGSINQQTQHQVYGGMLQVRSQALHRLEYLVPADSAQWKLLRNDYQNRARLYQEYRQQAAKNLYP